MRQEDTKHNWISQFPRLEHETHAKEILKHKLQEKMHLKGSWKTWRDQLQAFGVRAGQETSPVMLKNSLGRVRFVQTKTQWNKFQFYDVKIIINNATSKYLYSIKALWCCMRLWWHSVLTEHCKHWLWVMLVLSTDGCGNSTLQEPQ